MASYIRSFTFGVEDSLISTVGLLSGIAAGRVDRLTIVLTGLVLVFVEAFSMAIGALLSEQSAQEYLRHKEVPLSRALGTAAIMFTSYLLAGLVPLSPYIFFFSGLAFWLSIGLSLLALALLGIASARLFHCNIGHRTGEMIILGLLAIAVGIIVGRLLYSLTDIAPL